MIETKRIHWKTEDHEAKVEQFYGVGVERYGEYHNGYLNFGLWENDVNNYLTAAENLIRRMGTMIDLNSESKLLDVACGMGTQDIFLYNTFGCTIDALDVTWKHVEWTEKRIKEAQVGDYVRAHHGTATKLPFNENTFTHVVSIEGPEHFDTREDFLREAFRVLSPGGVIGLADYALKRKPKNLREKLVVEAARWLWKCPRENVETIDSYKQTMERCGFQNVTIEEVGALTIPGYYVEARRPENLVLQRRIRGRIATSLGFFVDYSVYKAFQDGLLEYVLVKGNKS